MMQGTSMESFTHVPRISMLSCVHTQSPAAFAVRDDPAAPRRTV